MTGVSLVQVPDLQRCTVADQARCQSRRPGHSTPSPVISQHGRHALRPTCTGHAAASPSAQMVWPSICLVISHSMSISSSRASPFFMRVMMSYSQPGEGHTCTRVDGVRA